MNEEITELIDELVAKAGPTTGQIKTNQDPDKVARLIELGWTPAEKELDSLEQIRQELQAIQKVLVDHEKRIKICSIQR